MVGVKAGRDRTGLVTTGLKVQLWLGENNPHWPPPEKTGKLD